VPVKREIVLLLTKMNRVLDFDETQGVLQCEAGMVLETAINLVGKHGYDVPYDLGARGSCTIGGNVSTHAGGINFVKYGPLRGNVLGLEVVLPSGKILNMMNTARKDSTGPDLKQIFIQSEGTLGIITKVALRCEASSPEKKLMFLDVTEYSHVLQVLNLAKQKFGRNLSAIEYMDHQSYDLVHSFKNKLLDFPFSYDQSLDQSQVKKWYVLVECSGRDEEEIMGSIEQFVETLDEAGIFNDMVVGENISQARNLWDIRESVAESATS
jgi:FAD/FMN-containing dehydrogenase